MLQRHIFRHSKVAYRWSFHIRNISSNSQQENGAVVNLSYTSFQDTNVPHGGPPVIIMHGMMGSSMNWRYISKALSRKTGRKIIAVDARNHGESPHTSEMDYNFLSRDILHLMDELEIQTACLMGHSMGGKAVMTTSLTCGSRVDSLIVVDVSPVASPAGSSFARYLQCMLKISSQLHDLPDISLPKARQHAIEKLGEIEQDMLIRQFLVRNLVEVDGKIRWRVNLDSIINNQPVMADFPKFDTTYSGPTLFIGGEKSQYITERHIPKIKQLYPAVQIKHIPRAGHWVHHDNSPEFISVVSQFLLSNSQSLLKESS